MSMIKKLWARLKHRKEHFSVKNMLELTKQHGLLFLALMIAWEIIEDVIFPAAFWALGKYVHPAFYAGIPTSWLLCAHWLVVPIVWKILVSRKKKRDIVDHVKVCHDHPSK